MVQKQTNLSKKWQPTVLFMTNKLVASSENYTNRYDNNISGIHSVSIILKINGCGSLRDKIFIIED